MLLLVLGAFFSVGAESEYDYYIQINTELNFLETGINMHDRDYMYDILGNIRTYVYDYARFLALNDRYNERILEISTLAAKAVELENVFYIEQARVILNEVMYGKENILEQEQSNHS